MKRLTAVLIALVMMCAAAVHAETDGTPDLYDLYDATENGRVWLGTAVPIMDGVAVTSPAGLPEKVTALEIWDGKAYRNASMGLPVADGKVLVLLHETDGDKPGIPAFELLRAGNVPQAGDLTVRSGDWMHSRVNRAVYDLSVISWNNRNAYLLTLSGDTAPGSPVITADGKLAGIITAEYAEGVNRYVALSSREISGCLQEAAGLLESPETGNPMKGYTVTAEGNLVTFDWSGAELPETAEGEKLYHVVADSESSYLTYTEVTEGLTEITMLLTPGRTYLSGVGAYAAAPDDLPGLLSVTPLPEAEPLTEYGFRSRVFAIAELPQDASEDTMPAAAEKVSEELLRSGRACIYSVTSYTVEQELDDITMLISLTTPEGDNYRYESGWYYDPEIMEKDEWYVRLSDTRLLTMLNENGYPAGTYEMAMFIDGKLADSFSFELIK